MREAASELMRWYRANGRVLPWRAHAGERPDPYRVWLSEIMLQQTTVAAVVPRYTAWLARWPTVQALAAAREDDVLGEWAGLGYYARARNLHAAAHSVAVSGFPEDEAGLRALPGIGDYTAAAIAAIAFGRAAVPVDANIARVGARLIAADLTAGELRARLAALFDGAPPGDLAQALMDLGAMVCRPRAPACPICPLAGTCLGARTGTPEQWPVRKAKPLKPLRRGVAFWIEAEHHVLIVKRPPRGLLGGMAALPSSVWSEELDPAAALADAPVAAPWAMLPHPVTHIFTHFRLELRIARTRLSRRTHADGQWMPIAGLSGAGLPTVFRKAVEAAQC